MLEVHHDQFLTANKPDEKAEALRLVRGKKVENMYLCLLVLS